LLFAFSTFFAANILLKVTHPFLPTPVGDRLADNSFYFML